MARQNQKFAVKITILTDLEINEKLSKLNEILQKIQ